MKIHFTTENGTRYELDQEQMTWTKLSTTARSGSIRNSSGHLALWPTIKMGEPAILEDDDVLPGCAQHLVRTSNVVMIAELP
jgi:hypothetical protein